MNINNIIDGGGLTIYHIFLKEKKLSGISFDDARDEWKNMSKKDKEIYKKINKDKLEESNKESTNEPIKESNKESNKESLNESIKESLNESIKESTKELIEESINESNTTKQNELLPKNYESYFDPKKGKTYYYNIETKNSSWIHPLDKIQETLPKNWVVYIDPKKKTFYYHNTESNIVQSKKPTNKSSNKFNKQKLVERLTNIVGCVSFEEFINEYIKKTENIGKKYYEEKYIIKIFRSFIEQNKILKRFSPKLYTKRNIKRYNNFIEKIYKLSKKK